MKQREIKFRAWDKKNKKMFYFDMKPQESYIDNLVLYGDNSWVFQNSELDENEKYTDNENGILLQFTGLTDKNGKEIYEADIVKHPQYPTPLRVEWDYDQWGLFDGICNEASIDEGCEIVGNIYKNKDL